MTARLYRKLPTPLERARGARSNAEFARLAERKPKAETVKSAPATTGGRLRQRLERPNLVSASSVIVFHFEKARQRRLALRPSA
jgi:hypothetical protein